MGHKIVRWLRQSGIRMHEAAVSNCRQAAASNDANACSAQHTKTTLSRFVTN